jgi:CBS domain-containing protein
MQHWIDPDDEPTIELTVIEVSADAIVREHAPLSEVRAKLLELGAPALAVVDREDCLRGIVRRSDIAGAPASASASDVMIDFEFARVCGRTGRIDVYFNSCHVSSVAR